MTGNQPPAQSAHKAWAAGAAAIIVYVLNGLVTGSWAAAESIAPAIAIVLSPLAVYATSNVPKE